MHQGSSLTARSALSRSSPGLTVQLARRILFATQTHSLHGGAERWLADLAAGLAGHGWQVRIAGANGPTFHSADRYLSAYPELRALAPIILHSRSGFAGGRRRMLEKALQEWKPDVVVPVLLHETIGAVARLRRGGQQMKLVYPVHESEVWAYRAVADNAQHIDAVFSVNRLMLDAIKCFSNWPVERSFHIPAGVILPERVADVFATGQPVRIGYCGKLVQSQKRIRDLIAFCRSLESNGRPYRLTITGEGAEGPALKRSFAAEVAAGQVVFLGALPQADLYRKFYPELDLLLITSERETGPLVAWEAMLHGLLILTSEYRGLRREGVLRHEDTALVFPVGDPVRGAEILCAALGDRDKLREIAARGRLRAEQALTVETMVERWSDALNCVLALPALTDAKVPCYDYRLGPREWLEDRIRSVLNRPFFSSNPHQEWPRYKIGNVDRSVRDKFVKRLDVLEASLDSGTCGLTSGT